MYPCTDLDLNEVKVPEGSRVKRIRIREFNESWHPDMYGSLERKKQPTMFSQKKNRSIVALHGIEMFDQDEKCIVQAGFF